MDVALESREDFQSKAKLSLFYTSVDKQKTNTFSRLQFC